MIIKIEPDIISYFKKAYWFDYFKFYTLVYTVRFESLLKLSNQPSTVYAYT